MWTNFLAMAWYFQVLIVCGLFFLIFMLGDVILSLVGSILGLIIGIICLIVFLVCLCFFLPALFGFFALLVAICIFAGIILAIAEHCEGSKLNNIRVTKITFRTKPLKIKKKPKKSTSKKKTAKRIGVPKKKKASKKSTKKSIKTFKIKKRKLSN